MLLHALVSSGYLVFGSGYNIYRLINYSVIKYSRILPQFVYASLGIASISARSLQNLVYNLLWKRYPIDPILAEEEQYNKNNNNFINWGLRTLGFSLIFHALLVNYKISITGSIVLILLVTSEVINFLKKKLPIQLLLERLISTTNNRRLASFVKIDFVPYFWIISTELFGLIVSNNYIRAANFPFSLAALTYRPPEGFNHEWSVRCAMNDYMMLAYTILVTEAFCQSQID
ncbi:uncharacterized protein [Chelonus insularis]|uniref:uncharacterized protein n=1 Tax=Chelonus insularis TaxID=460826 RepID=UPI00158F1E22|nr:uncharacterized protein LOC118071703 [Chelonus insularis]